MMASEVIDFPDPDSPTNPSTSPAAIENESPRTAAAEASRAETVRPERDCGNSMVSSRTSSNGRTRTMVSAAKPTSYFFGRDSGGTNPATR